MIPTDAPATARQKRRLELLRRSAGLEPLLREVVDKLTVEEAAQLIRAMKPRGIGAASLAGEGGLFA